MPDGSAYRPLTVKYRECYCMTRSFTFQHTIRACYLGLVTESIIGNLVPLLFLIFRARFGLDLTQVMLLTTLNFIVQLAVDLIAAFVVDKLGYRVCTFGGHIFVAVGLCGLGIFPFVLRNAYAGLLLAVFLYAFGGGFIGALISPIMEASPSDNKASAMSLLHSFACWGSVAVIFFSTAFLQIFGENSWRVLCILWALLPICNACLFAKVPLRMLPGEKGNRAFVSLLKTPIFWLFMLMMVVSGASEYSMSQWASAFAESGLHISKLAGDICGPCFFAVMMGFSRIFYGKRGQNIDLLRFILLSAALCVGAYLLTSFSPLPILSLLGCGMVGLSVGILWPGVFSIAVKTLPQGGTALFALLSVGGSLGCTAGSTLVGTVSRNHGDDLHFGLLAAVIFPLLMLFFASYLKRFYHPEKKG